MRHILFLSLCICLSACDTGTPEYWHIDPVRVEANGMVYDVRQNGLMAEALRTNMTLSPRFAQIAQGAAQAISQTTGCKVLELRGDPSIVEARLECAGEKAPKFKAKKRLRICDVRYDLPDKKGQGRARALCR